RLLAVLAAYLREAGQGGVAVAVAVRSGARMGELPDLVERTGRIVSDLRLLFLNARDETLIARFSETRCRHPLANDDVTLTEAIRQERATLAEIAEMAHNL